MARLRRSLLTRVALSFAAAVALTAIALSLAAYYVTKHDQDTGSLSDALEQSRQNLIVADAMLPPAPVQADYEALMTAFTIRGDFDTLIQTGTETYRSGLDVDEDSVTAELAAAVATGNVRYQTVDSEVGPVIVVGSQLRGGALTIYFLFPQGDRLAGLAGLRNVLIIAGVLLAVFGAIAGFFLARRLLLPIRRASRAALQMSRGDLDIRLPSGSDEFGLLAQSFNQMAGNLQAKMLDLEAGQARERRFVADVTHELRTPIAALVGEASLLKTRLEAEPGACPPEVERLAEMVSTDIARLRRLVDELLEICRIDAQAAESVIEPVEVGAFLRQLVDAHAWSESVSVARVLAEPEADAGEAQRSTHVALADKRLLERIVVNLIENALTHGSAPVSLESRVTRPSSSGRRGLVSVAVTDSGSGIPIEDLPHIFDRFYKADPSRSSGRGSGLGLAIARENARLLGGDLTAANIPRGGARFVLTLPLAEM